MAKADIQISVRGGEMEGGFMRFKPGDWVQGTAYITPDSDLKCNHVYIRLQWHTEGRGDRDEGRAAIADAFQGTLSANMPAHYPFSLQLPHQPWSFAGHYINIIWEVVVEIDVPLALDIRQAYPIIVAPR